MLQDWLKVMHYLCIPLPRPLLCFPVVITLNANLHRCHSLTRISIRMLLVGHFHRHAGFLFRCCCFFRGKGGGGVSYLNVLNFLERIGVIKKNHRRVSFEISHGLPMMVLSMYNYYVGRPVSLQQCTLSFSNFLVLSSLDFSSFPSLGVLW